MKTRFLLGCAVVSALLLAGCGDAPRNEAGQVTASAGSDAFHVKVGDCTGELGDGSVSDVTLIPCAQKHNWEAYHSEVVTDEEYPGEAKIREKAEKTCEDKYKAYSGISSSKSKYSITYMYPTQASWLTANDREILCLVGSDTATITGSVKGTKK